MESNQHGTGVDYSSNNRYDNGSNKDIDNDDDMNNDSSNSNIQAIMEAAVPIAVEITLRSDPPLYAELGTEPDKCRWARFQDDNIF